MIELAIVLVLGAVASAIFSMVVEAPIIYYVTFAPLFGAIVYLALGLIGICIYAVKPTFRGLVGKHL
jgi:hypothetical protein